MVLLNKIILWSHGFGAQFHSGFLFMLLSKFYLTKLLEWDYDEAHHGKRSMDGVGVTVKRFVFRAVK